MGEAKRRGTYEERKEEAVARGEELLARRRAERMRHLRSYNPQLSAALTAAMLATGKVRT